MSLKNGRKFGLSAVALGLLLGGCGYDGVQLNGVGIPALLSSGQAGDQNAEYFITQTGAGAAKPLPVNRHVIVTGARLNYLQRR